MSEVEEIPMYVATQEFWDELHELGYELSIELEDLLDLYDDDDELGILEDIRPTGCFVSDLRYAHPYYKDTINLLEEV
jgi:hypothetical protein